MFPSVAVGIHVYAEPERLLATIAALRDPAVTTQPVRLILLADGPDAPTAAMLPTLADLDQVQTPEARGGPWCFNTLLAATSAEITIFLESGVVVGPGWLDRLRGAFGADERIGLAGPSTNRSWNEQAVFRHADGAPQTVARMAAEAARRFGDSVVSLAPLHSLGDFCYAVRHEVVAAVGAADEGYGFGPCWEMEYSIRAVRAGFRGVWVRGAYVYRSPATVRRRREEAARFTASKHRYQDAVCGLRLRRERTGYEPHCRGEACQHFAPTGLIRIHRPLPDRAPTQPPAVHSGPPIEVRDDQPLVSCIMPTHNRRVFVAQALRCFEQQDYPRLELIVVDDGDESVADLMPADQRIRYLTVPGRQTIGAKRNLACEAARGEIVAHWDDDDWYGPGRIRRQVAPLLAGAADITGLETACIFDPAAWRAWSLDPALHARLFVHDVHGGTLVYRRSVWERLARFPAVSLAEDAHFLRAACRRGARLAKVPAGRDHVYVRHGTNAWRFVPGSYLDPAGWREVDPDAFLPESDRDFYRRLRAPGTAPRIDGSPLVSCIMPTADRRAFVPRAIAYFLRQHYPHRELIVLDDGEDAVSDLIPPDPSIRYVRLERRLVLGAKRNRACELAQGEIVAHWDDDDWQEPNRLRTQVDELIRRGAEICGPRRPFYFDPAMSRGWRFEYPPSGRPWVAGNALCYRKTQWATRPFPEIAIGEDTQFVWAAARGSIAVFDDAPLVVGLIHPGNTSRKALSGPFWREWPIGDVERLLGADLPSFRGEVTDDRKEASR